MNIIKQILIFIYWEILYKLFCILPIQKKIFFESFLGKDYSDNPKYIFEYLRRSNLEYKYVWSFKEKKEIEKANSVKKMSINYIYELATSKYIINNSRMPLKWQKRKNQVYIQTWHGTPLKRLVYDMENVTLPDTNKKLYLSNFTKDVNKWDYLISPNEYSTNIFKSAFNYDGKVIESGYPRNETLYNVSEEEIINIKQKINIDLNKKVILYAPTFRDNKFLKKGQYIQDVNINLQKIKEVIGEDVVLILRNHYLVKKVNYKYDSKSIIDLTTYDNINDLYKISDLLITDYSSVFFDYILLNKPIIFYQYDQKEYEEDIRGFYIPLEDLPGKVVKNEEELYEILSNTDIKNKINYSQFLNKYKLSNIKINSSEEIFKKF